MNQNQIIDSAKVKFSNAVNHFSEDLKKIRTGRAHPSQLDSVLVVAYGTQMPLKQLATVTTPEAQLLQVSPFDPTNLPVISDTIRNNPSLGMNPSDDGRVIRIPIPPLTTERRQEIVKQLKEKIENALISCRGIRHETLDSLKEMKNDKQISEDDLTRCNKQIEDIMTKTKNEIEAVAKIKEQEIMTI
jgi:ribosome recycling factor